VILAIIPARAGSKRLPGKNTINFGGRPLLAWSVALAKRLSQVHCVVSTDDSGIAEVARQAGAFVIERPAELAADDSAMVDVMVHAARMVREQGVRFDSVLLLQPTNPLRPVDMVERAMARFMSELCDSMISVSRRQLKLGAVENGVFVPNYAPITQSRIATPIYYENGLLYFTKVRTLLESHSVYGERTLAFETERPFDEVDIDEPVDLLVGEAILRAVSSRLGY
jgi:N-acylneuraminate cytidylyltransferase